MLKKMHNQVDSNHYSRHCLRSAKKKAVGWIQVCSELRLSQSVTDCIKYRRIVTSNVQENTLIANFLTTLLVRVYELKVIEYWICSIADCFPLFRYFNFSFFLCSNFFHVRRREDPNGTVNVSVPPAVFQLLQDVNHVT
jgi:hypothetical protein